MGHNVKGYTLKFYKNEFKVKVISFGVLQAIRGEFFSADPIALQGRTVLCCGGCPGIVGCLSQFLSTTL